MTNGIEGAWTQDPLRWDNDYLTNLLGFEWKTDREPRRLPAMDAEVDPDAPKTPDAHIAGSRHDLMMMTSDIALKEDPAYREGVRAVPQRLRGLRRRLLTRLVQADPPRHGAEGPLPRPGGAERESLPWQDPIPPSITSWSTRRTSTDAQEARILDAGASVLRAGRGGVGVGLHLPRQRQAGRRQRGARAARPAEGLGGQRPGRTAGRRPSPRSSASGPTSTAPGRQKRVSMADLIVLGGVAAVEKAAAAAGVGHDGAVRARGGHDAIDEH